MLAALGREAMKKGFALRLSTSIPLAFEQRMPNPTFNPQTPVETPYIYLIIPVEEWLTWFADYSSYIQEVTSMSKKWSLKTIIRDIAIKTPFHTTSEIKFQLQEYLLRRGLYKSRKLVLFARSKSIWRHAMSTFEFEPRFQARLFDMLLKIQPVRKSWDGWTLSWRRRFLPNGISGRKSNLSPFLSMPSVKVSSSV